MTLSETVQQDLPDRIGDGGFALLAALTYVALQAAAGFPSLSSASDNDSMLRLVEIRDLLSGQGWFDLHQYRMGTNGGLLMHWSRLVDAPISAIILMVKTLGGSMAAAEKIALVAWPALLFAGSLYFLLRAARFFHGAEALLPTLLIGAASLHYVGVFIPGSLDHHNVQLVLVLGMLSFLAEASRNDSAVFGAAGGLCAALLLGVAIEGVPYVGVAGMVVALWFLKTPSHTWRMTCGFGLAFGAAAAAIFVATVPLDGWLQPACDAYSLPQFAAASLSGLGIAVIASISGMRLSASRRTLALAGLGLCLASMAMLFFPQCLGDPYAGLDPRLKSWWLDAVTEAQPVWKFVQVSPGMAAARYGPPLIALSCLATAQWRSLPRRSVMLLAALLGAAVLVSLWQVRGSVFSVPLAVLPLASLVANRRRLAVKGASATAIAGVALAWLLSFNAVWSVSSDALATMWLANARQTDKASSTANACAVAHDFDQLAGMTASVVLTISNLGSPVLRHTPHHVLAGPYHRNVKGNLVALDAFAGPLADVPAILRRHDVEYVALCRGNGESEDLARRSPKGLMASLLSRSVPHWLKITPESKGAPLEIYKVLQTE